MTSRAQADYEMQKKGFTNLYGAARFCRPLVTHPEYIVLRFTGEERSRMLLAHPRHLAGVVRSFLRGVVKYSRAGSAQKRVMGASLTTPRYFVPHHVWEAATIVQPLFADGDRIGFWAATRAASNGPGWVTALRAVVDATEPAPLRSGETVHFNVSVHFSDGVVTTETSREARLAAIRQFVESRDVAG